MEKNPRVVFVSVIILGLLFDFLFYKVPVGANFVIFSVILLLVGWRVLYFYKIQPHHNNYWLVIPISFFVLVTIVRNEPLTKFLAFVFTVFSMALLIVYYQKGQWFFGQFWNYLSKFIQLLLSTIYRPLNFFSAVKKNLENNRKIRFGKEIIPIIRGLMIATPLVLILGSLLASADVVFKQKLISFFANFSIKSIQNYLSQFLLILVVAYLCLGVLIFTVSTNVSEMEREKEKRKPEKKYVLGFIETIIILGSVFSLFFSFMVIQFQYFFGGHANIGIQGYTFSQYARRGFNGLIIVAFISLVLIVGLGKNSKRENRTQKWIFSSLTLIIVGFVEVILFSAFHRLTLAIDWHGYSRLRLYPKNFIFWLGFVLIAVVLLEISRREHFVFMVFLIASVGYAASLILFNVDAAIVKTNVQRALEGKHFNVTHLSSLSSDAIPTMVNAYKNKSNPIDVKEALGAALICYIYSDDYNDVKTLDWRSYNYSKRQAYQSVNEVQKELEIYHVISGKKPILIDTPGDERYRCDH